MKFEIKDRLLGNMSKDFMLEDIKGIVLHSSPNFFNKDVDAIHDEVFKENREKTNYGYHYVIDGDIIYRFIKEEYVAKSLEEDKNTYISQSLFSEDPNNNLISIYIVVRENESYKKTEEYAIRFIVSLLKKHKLTANDIWRAFDLKKESYSPFHVLERNIFEKYIKEFEKFIPKEDIEDDRFPNADDEKEIESLSIKKDEEINEDDIEIVSPFKEVSERKEMTIDQYVYTLFKNNLEDPKSYASKFQPWDKGIEEAKSVTVIAGDFKTRTTPHGNTFQYKVNEHAPKGLDHCEQTVDELDGIQTSEETLVEPIYPDLITPPGDMVHFADGFSETKVQSKSNVSLTPEEFEKKQKTFDFSKFENMKKETKGRPINTEDPFPVDDQIRKLEGHFPKVKVDKITLNFKDSNHPNNEIGNAMAKNYAMCYDMVTEIAKRTEKRLVKIENNLATVMRNLFRMSSRVNINCTYYGGQSVFGKYKCIRCLHDDRINDGAIVTIDQCMNCTRYEPILGQVYAILDETGSNIVQVIDDLQMSYTSLQDYKDLNSVDGYHQEPLDAKVNQNPSEKPKSFIENKWKDTEEEIKIKKEEEKKKQESNKKNEEETEKEDKDEKNSSTKEDKDEETVFPNGFKMDWSLTNLESQMPNINTYDKEGLKAEKKAIESNKQGIKREIFEDSREGAVENERLEFDIKDYEFDDFGNRMSMGSTNGAGMALEVRNKICEYAREAVKLCSEGKAKYSQQYRYNHGDKALNGISYWDCSSLVQRAYEAAGISGIGTNTATQYPYCLDKQGGKLFKIDRVSDALPGDMVWFKTPPHPSTDEELQNINYGNTREVHHVAIYLGDNKYAHASRAHDDPKDDIVISPLGWDKNEIAFGRPKALIDLDMSSGEGISGNHHWSREFHGITDEWWKKAEVAESNVSGFVKNMEKYNYKDLIINISKEKGFDPYLTAALIAIESTGDPRDNDKYAGLMQVEGHYGSTTREGMADNIRKGIEKILAKRTALKQFGWKEENIHVLVSAYNSGEGTVIRAAGNNYYGTGTGPKIDLGTTKIPELGTALYNHVKSKLSWDPVEKQTYAVKVLRAYNIIYSKNYLGLPQEANNPPTFSGTFIRPVPHAVTSPYGTRVHPVTGVRKMHTGVDFGSPMGYSIKASAAGTVRSARMNGAWGNQVIIDHGNNKSTMYAHLSKFSCKAGDKVSQGQEVGKIGTTGMSTGAHLHFEIHNNDKHMDPMPHLKNS